MKTFILLLALSTAAFAATKTDDGGLILEPGEVARTIAMFNSMQYTIDMQQQRLQQLEQELETLAKAKCT